MSCNVCDPTGKCATGGFTTEAQFIAEDSRIRRLISDGSAVAIPGSTGFELMFKCNSCGQYWELVAPDWAMRGSLRKVPTRDLQVGRAQP